MPQTAAEIMARTEAELIAILKDRKAEVFVKAKACQRLAVVGTKASVPALARLLTDENVAHYARFGLEPMTVPEAGKALRKAVGKTRGALRVGVMNSLAARKDPKAFGSFRKLLKDGDPQVAKAAAFGLAKLGGARAAEAIRKAWKDASPVQRASLAHAGFACAAELNGAEAEKMYALLRSDGAPEAVRRMVPKAG